MADYNMADVQSDATAYGGRNTGFDPAYSEALSGESTYNSGVDDFMFDDFMSNDLASMYSQGSSSTGVYGNPAAPNTTPFSSSMAAIDDFFKNNTFGKIAGTVMNFTPQGRAINAIRGVGSMLGRGDMLGTGATALGAFGGLPGAVVNAGYQASQGRMGPAGSLAGGMALGPAGSFIGGQVGNMANGRGPVAPGTGGTNEAAGGIDWGGVIGGLAGLYGNRGGGNIDGAAADNQAVSQQIQSLGSMYGPNSPYAAQLRQTLERKDAASGRRSQYGPREAQLMAMLADKQASVSDSMGRLAQTNQANQIALQDRKRLQTGQNLATVGQLLKSSGLMNMFNGGSAPTSTPIYKDNYDDSTWMGTE